MRPFADNCAVKALDPVADHRRFFSQIKNHFNSEHYNLYLNKFLGLARVRLMGKEITVSGLHGLARARRLTDPVRFVHKKMTGSKQ